MARRPEAPVAIGEHKEPLLTAVRTADAGKPAAGKSLGSKGRIRSMKRQWVLTTGQENGNGRSQSKK
jgi:hypothetical protein